ncbi:WGR domain-containing protein [Flavivirga jejuensis]|uniref:WGR domain-containing protein n=1 Tax=Flavivirga jejuensis TaxID=870487 RepID=A0ABT8WJT0_9FLAO|nr:WGR domain-containing protein [Flavivirga jejuensis]MDO5973226.1 WGR domain-containing protein [Flavivirga jejuensis]
MKIQQQKKLYFTEGKSDKVYEIDLCESGAGLFVVNFRYGRRGANLREGTKTIFPVDYEEALKVYNKLIADKEKKGYSESGVVSQPVSVNAGREKTILKYLKEAVAGTYSRDWKVSRIIWRAAQLNIKEASNYIGHFFKSNDEFEQYAAVYALCVLEDANYIDSIYDVFNTHKFKNKQGRVAVSYLFKLANNDIKDKVVSEVVNHLPIEIKNHISNDALFFIALNDCYLKDKDIDASLLYYIYLLTYNKSINRNQFYDFLQKIPLKVNTFKSLRYIYRASHLLNDYTFFGLISKKIGVSKPGYVSNYIYVNNKWEYADDEKVKENPSIAFSKKTKSYFNKTTYALVYHLSKTNITGYIDYAVALLIALDDNIDRKTEDVQYNYIYDAVERRYITEKRIFPKYHDFQGLMYVLYGNSSRLNRENSKWFYTEETNYEDLPREETLPKVWNTKPEKVLQILRYAKSEEAVYFALRIIKENNSFLEALTLEVLRDLITHYHPKVLEVILETVENKYINKQPEDAILLALLSSKNERAKGLAFGWLNSFESDYFSRPEFVASLLLTGEEDVISYLKSLYEHTVKYNVTLLLSQLEALFITPSKFSLEYFIAVNGLIGDTKFGVLLSDVSADKIRDLASSNSINNKLFAANLAKHNKIDTYLLFKDTIDDYINSEEASLRQVGIELLSHFPDEFLLENNKKISAFCFSEYAEVRKAIEPTIEKLLRLDESFKNNFFKELLTVITIPERYEGLHENCYVLLTENYSQHLNAISQESIFNLLLSNYDYAQKLGAPLFKEQVDLHNLPVKDSVVLGNCDVYDIRKLLQNYFEAHTDRINYELEHALLIFNSSWQDVIDWACNYFEKYIIESNWTVDMLLYACDHTKKEVQAFGRKMITLHFSEDKGLPLLLKLQEHPAKDMQFFVTNYLNTYAKDNLEVILKLETYFRSSLFNINTNRATKTRVYTFLEQESVKYKEVAEMTVRLMDAVLGTKTIQDRSNNIDLLLTISEAFPDIDIPLLIKSN